MSDPQFASETRITTQLPLDPFRVIANEQITGITNMITQAVCFVNVSQYNFRSEYRPNSCLVIRCGL
jgi:hypothetical protein